MKRAHEEDDDDDGFGDEPSSKQHHKAPRSGTDTARKGAGASSSSSAAAHADDDDGDDGDGGDGFGDDVMGESDGERGERERYADTRMTGVITRVSMRNVRCHAALEVTLGPRINFLCGENGSGKSSILTAILLALGGEPKKLSDKSADSVSARYKNVIKEDCNAASVEVDLCNEGAPTTMIEPGKYGRVITIRREMKRTVSADGAKTTISNKFSVINKDTGKTIAEGTKADKIGEFVEIRERLNIDVKNPVVCMDQELSKKFITGNAKDFYQAFMEATLLQRDYNLILESTDKLLGAKDSLKTAEQANVGTKEACDKATRRWDAIQALTQFEAQKKAAENDLMWALYAEEEAKLATTMSAVSTAQNKRERVRDVLPTLEAKVAEAEGKLHDAEAGLQAAQETLQGLEGQLDAKAEEINKVSIALGRKNTEAKLVRDSVTRAEKRLAEAQREFDAFDAELAKRDKGAELRRWRNRIAGADKDFEAATAALEAVRAGGGGGSAGAEEAVEAAASELDAREADATSAEAAFTSKKRELDALRALGAGEEDVHSFLKRQTYYKAKTMVRAMELIAKAPAGTFQRPPIGPVFKHVKCKDPKWARAVEGPLTPIMDQFILTSNADGAAFERLLNSAGLSSVSYFVRAGGPVAPEKRASVEQGLAKGVPGHKRLLDVLDVDEPTVFLELLRVSSGDTVVLVDSLNVDVAVDAVTQEGPSGDRVMLPRVKHALLPDGATVYVSGQHGNTSVKASGRGDSSMTLLRPTSRGEQVKMAAQGMAESEARARAARAAVGAAKTALVAARNVAATAARRLSDAEGVMKRAAIARNAANNAPEPQPEDDSEEESRRQQLQLDVDSARAKVAELAPKLAGLVADAAALLPQLARAQAELKALQASLENNEDIAGAKSEVEAATEAVKSAKKTQATGQARFDEYAAAVEAAKAAAKAESAKLDAAKATVIEKTGTDRPRAEAEGLTSAQARANAKARAEAHAKEKGKFAGVDTEAVRTAYLTAKAAHQAAKAQTDKLQDNVSQLTGMKSARQKAFNLLHERAQKSVAQKFSDLVAEKGYMGKLDFIVDPEDRTYGEISIKVAPDAAMRYKGKKAFDESLLQEAASLSGGEKSFAGLMFLSAVTQASSDIPFHAIDEFDVFQDEKTRKKSMDLLIDEGSKPGPDGRFGQFILLTPLDITSSVQLTPKQKEFIKVIRLVAPKGAAPNPA